MDALGRDDELRSLHAFLDRPAAGGHGGAGAGGRGGDREVDALARRRRGGARARASRPLLPARRGRAGGRACRRWETCSRTRSGTCCASWKRPGVARSRPRCCSGRRRAQPVDFRTLAVAVRSALQLLAERRADPARDRRRPVAGRARRRTALEFALRRLQGDDIRLLLARRLADGIPVSELELALDERPARARARRPAQPGRAARRSCSRGSAGRSRGRPCCACTKSSGGNAFFALELARALGTDVDPTQPLPVPETLEALVRARLDGLPDETRRALLLACTHGRLTPAQLDGDALEPAFADHVIELADGVIRFTHPLLASVLYQAASPSDRRRAHERLAEIVDDPLARARHRALAAA